MSEQENQKKPKHKKIRFNPKEMTRLDSRTFQYREYVIYNSERKGWICDCKDYMFGNINCKHIQAAKDLIAGKEPKILE